mgnify:CR=1 FL=1
MGSEFMDHGNSELASRYGNPVEPKGNGSFQINQRYFAGSLLAENHLRFVVNRWYIFDGKCWHPVARAVIIKKTSDLFTQWIQSTGYLSLQSQITVSLLTSIEKIAQSFAFFAEFPSMDWRLVPCQNTVLRWDDVSAEFVPEEFSPEQNVRFLLAVDYAPNTDYEEFKRNVLEEVLGVDDSQLLQRYLGAALLPVNLTENFLLLQGIGGSSKSLLVRLLVEILGDGRVFDLNIKALGHDYELSGLDGQTLLVASESAGDALCSSGASFIKKMVGGDKIQTRLKYINEKRQLCGNYSLIIVSNEQTAFHYEGSGEEWRRRLLPIFFTKRHGKVIKGLVHQLLEQHGAGILNWLLVGAAEVLRLQWQIPLTPDQEIRRDRLIARSEPVRLFIENCIGLSAGDDFSSEEAYTRYCELGKDGTLPILAREAFFRQFAVKMLEVFPGATGSNNIRRDKRTSRGYRGYKLKERTRI